MANKSNPITQSTSQPASPQASPAVVQQLSATPPIVATAGSGNGKKVTLLASVQALIIGLQTYYQPTDVFQLQGGPMTRDELVADLQTFITAALKTSAANAAWRAAVQSERALETHIREERSQVKGIVTARFGKGGAQLLTFGYLPQRPRKTKAATTAVAVVKREATRKARGTRGKVQKQDIHGDVNAQIVVTPGNSQASGSNGSVPAGVATTAAAPGAPAPSTAPAAAPAVGNGTK
jgi:hypothetical protein